MVHIISQVCHRPMIYAFCHLLVHMLLCDSLWLGCCCIVWHFVFDYLYSILYFIDFNLYFFFFFFKHKTAYELRIIDWISDVCSSDLALAKIGLPPPFWAFAWAGGQALARYLLDNPQVVAGRRVVDFASGSGIVAVAALKAGAASVLAADIDPFCAAAVGLNGEANGVAPAFTGEALLDPPPPKWAEVILAGDICYEKPLAERAMASRVSARAPGAHGLNGHLCPPL